MQIYNKTKEVVEEWMYNTADLPFDADLVMDIKGLRGHYAWLLPEYDLIYQHVKRQAKFWKKKLGKKNWCKTYKNFGNLDLDTPLYWDMEVYNKIAIDNNFVCGKISNEHC